MQSIMLPKGPKTTKQPCSKRLDQFLVASFVSQNSWDRFQWLAQLQIMNTLDESVWSMTHPIQMQRCSRVQCRWPKMEEIQPWAFEGGYGDTKAKVEFLEDILWSLWAHWTQPTKQNIDKEYTHLETESGQARRIKAKLSGHSGKSYWGEHESWEPNNILLNSNDIILEDKSHALCPDFT